MYKIDYCYGDRYRAALFWTGLWNSVALLIIGLIFLTWASEIPKSRNCIVANYTISELCNDYKYKINVMYEKNINNITYYTNHITKCHKDKFIQNKFNINKQFNKCYIVNNKLYYKYNNNYLPNGIILIIGSVLNLSVLPRTKLFIPRIYPLTINNV